MGIPEETDLGVPLPPSKPLGVSQERIGKEIG